ncbi:hypothetical protein TEA_025946 [Camellia sinensis var. sinensis]|uniref:LOB domain-containing protein n=1 Tax=Camellia sinensis var. sinensis TaxID=542762 RepID=A0A4S4F2B9_CAMSN|nr:hypothetical protein TEA_025946 [Camellia sinensis var. sinensis]
MCREMSCNGCRVLRKGCNDNCILRQSIQALFQSLLFEACGRTVNPVNGAVGLLWTGNWHVCQAAVETVLRGGALRPIPEFSGASPADEFDDASNTNNHNIDFFRSRDLYLARKAKNNNELMITARQQPASGDLDDFPARMRAKRRAETPSLNSEESETTTLESERFGFTRRKRNEGPNALSSKTISQGSFVFTGMPQVGLTPQMHQTRHKSLHSSKLTSSKVLVQLSMLVAGSWDAAAGCCYWLLAWATALLLLAVGCNLAGVAGCCWWPLVLVAGMSYGLTTTRYCLGLLGDNVGPR